MKQLGFEFKTRGGKRKGAGRKPVGPKAGVSHRPRRVVAGKPLHVTVKVLPHVWNLRSGRSMDRIRPAVLAGATRFGIRLTEFSIQGNHVHLIVEAPNRTVLAQGIKGLSVRVARGLNKMMGGRGRVFADRYHSRPLQTPTEVRNAVHYVRTNYRHHNPTATFVDPYASINLVLPLPRPVTWPLRTL